VAIALVVGLVTALLYERSRSTVLCMALHAIVNAGGVALLLAGAG
jgi:membrane protease YdiL (CAAX protease family)